MKRPLILAAIALVAVLGTGMWYVAANAEEATSTQIAPTEVASETLTPVANDDGIMEMVLGNPDAKVTLTEYASFTCPHCANFHTAVFKDLKKNYIDTNKIKFVYRDVYFDRFGLWAAMVARCEGGSRFFGITDIIYKTQSEWVEGGDPAMISGRLRTIGKVAGLSEEALDACLSDNDKAKALVAWFKVNAEADDVTGTPTLIINGEKHPNMNYADLSAILDEKLAE